MIGFIVEKIKSIKNKYLNRSPKEKWKFVRDIGIHVLRTTGVPVLHPNFEVYWYSYAAGFVIVDVTISFVYFVWYFTGRDTIKGMLNVPLYFGVLIPSGINYLLVMITSKRKMYQSLAFFGGDRIYTNFNQKSHPKYIRACDQSAIKLLKDTAVTLLIVVGSMNVYLGFPVYSYIFKHELQLPIPVLLPFTDDESPQGLLLNFSNQIFVALVGLSGNFGVEIITCILKNNVCATAVAIGFSIEELTDVLESSETKLNAAIDLQFRNILVQVQDFDRFILELSEFYYWKFFLRPILCNFSVAIALFYYFFVDWTAGLGAAFFIYSQLYILCDIGNEVDKTNDELFRVLCDMPWYLLSCENQLAFAHLLNRIQNGAILKIGPFGVLSFVTFSEMTKRIYTILMALKRFME